MKTKLLVFLTGILVMPLCLMASVEEQPQVPEEAGEEYVLQPVSEGLFENESENTADLHRGGKACGPKQHDRRDCGQDEILAHSFPVPVPLYGNVCRNGLFYCTTPPLPVGTSCHCWDMFGYIWLYGTIHTW